MSRNHNLTIIAGGYIVRVSRPKYRVLIAVRVENITIKGEYVMTEFKRVGQFVEFEVLILDGKGRPANVDGDLTVANSNEIAGGVFFDQTTKKGKLTCLDEGIGQVTFTGDADLSPNVTTPVIGVLDFVSNLSGAVVVQVNAGPVQEPVV